ncbi:PIN domain-containing protein [Citrobacter freundii]|uniref:PIN domain-containing protein n=1 Tax=Citrobacter freundii TaxID=546 RepID=UPI0027E59DB4|nr:PIN domain-containing protein [Citrobacter freundii]WME26926.1 PIN domain-containing protein [Citrobacter freundii]
MTITVGCPQTNRKTDTGKTLKPWPVLVDHYNITIELLEFSAASAIRASQDAVNEIRLNRTVELLKRVNTTSAHADAVFEEAMVKFRALMDNGLTEHVPVSIVDTSQVFRDYFSGVPPFHREAKKSEFPDAFSLAAVDKVARERCHKVYIISADDDMKAVAEQNPNFIHLEKLEQLLDLVNRNDEELAGLSGFADSVLQQLQAGVLDEAREKLEGGEFVPVSSGDIDHDVSDIKIFHIEIAELQLIDVDTDGATYDVVFNVSLEATYNSVDYSKVNWDREGRVMYGMQECSDTFRHLEQYSARIEIGFVDGLKANAELLDVSFEDTIFDLDLDEAEYIERPAPVHGQAGREAAGE